MYKIKFQAYNLRIVKIFNSSYHLLGYCVEKLYSIAALIDA